MHKKRETILLLAVISIVAILFISFLAGAFSFSFLESGEEFVGQAIKAIKSERIKVSCTDTDFILGAVQNSIKTFNIYVKGEITFTDYKKQNDKLIPFIQKKIDKCKDEFYLNEYSCEDYNSKSANIESTVLKSAECKFGCNNELAVCNNAPSCTNKIKDNDEEKVDCGGKNCKACPEKQFCEDSDELNYENKGFATVEVDSNGKKEKMPIDDYCKDGKVLLEQACDVNGYIEKEYDCSLNNYEKCDGGKCVGTALCFDSDFGYDIHVKGKTTPTMDNLGATILTDYCTKDENSIQVEKGAKYIKEFTCEKDNLGVITGYLTNKNIICPSGEWCYDGACIETVCKDSDDGIDKYKSGIVGVVDKATENIILQSSSDACVLGDNFPEYFGGILYENHCSDSNDLIKSKQINCDESEICYENNMCKSKTYLFCSKMNPDLWTQRTPYYLEGNTCKYQEQKFNSGTNTYDECLHSQFVISDGSLNKLYVVEILNWPLQTNIITFSFNYNVVKFVNPNYIIQETKTYTFKDEEENTFEYNGIKFTLLIDIVKKSIFFKDLGTYPPELQNIQCPKNLNEKIKDFGDFIQNAVCVDTDGEDIYTKGKAGIGTAAEEDSCTDSANGISQEKGIFAIEKVCKNNQVETLYQKCPNNNYCSNGKCQPVCQELGDSGFDISKKGQVIDISTNNAPQIDFCVDKDGNKQTISNYIKEYSCENNKIKTKSLKCEVDKICQNGACTNPYCQDSDGGEIFSVKGITSGYDANNLQYVNKVDGCSIELNGKSTDFGLYINELICKNNKVVTVSKKCGGGQTCYEGKCVSCTETDLNGDINKKGISTGISSENNKFIYTIRTDTCINNFKEKNPVKDSNMLYEYKCGGLDKSGFIGYPDIVYEQSYISATGYPCNCVDGACIDK